MILDELDKCTGCSTCKNVCPRNAITMQPDKEGFRYPVIDSLVCNQCGLCREKCPICTRELNVDRTPSPGIYAARASDDELRSTSSSGGIFSILAQSVFSDGGCIFGAGYGNDTNVIHKCAKDPTELIDLQGSKYVQSDIGDTFRQVKEWIQCKKLVLFSGTPCQVAGLYSFLGGDNQYLITCDLVCHGVPSPKLFKKYLDYANQKHRGKIINVTFRDKRGGWRQFILGMHFKDGRYIWEMHPDNAYFIAFIKNICLRKSCHMCSFKGIPCVADITLGDFWNINSFDPSIDDNKGTSLVLVNSSKGQMFWEKSLDSLFFRQCSPEYLDRKSPLFLSVAPHTKRNEFMENMDVYDFPQLIRKYLPPRSRLRKILSHVKMHIKNRFDNN